jgi:receptor protein-tyrosine kinase
MNTPLIRERSIDAGRPPPPAAEAANTDARPRKAVAAPCLVPAHSLYHERSEQIRMLRTELLLRHDTPGANLFAVVSANPGEGRSQLAAELAISCSQLGQPTLLVDADLRRPRQHALFDADNRRGLACVLALGMKPFLQSVQGLPSLALLTSGPLPPNPLELLSDSRFEDTVAKWREQFAFVVIDTAPISRYADALAVATISGRVLSISRAKQTSYRAVRDMQRRLAATRARTLGAVINHF